ncbi:Uncharacterized protein DBV15_00104, partial [Temnothorax longispinosus]
MIRIKSTGVKGNNVMNRERNEKCSRRWDGRDGRDERQDEGGRECDAPIWVTREKTYIVAYEGYALREGAKQPKAKKSEFTRRQHQHLGVDLGWIGSNHASILLIKRAERFRATDGGHISKKRTMQFNKGRDFRSPRGKTGTGSIWSVGAGAARAGNVEKCEANVEITASVETALKRLSARKMTNARFPARGVLLRIT